MPIPISLSFHPNWKIILNEFYDIDPSATNFQSDLKFYFMEDILEIKNQKNNTLIHMGWYPEFDPMGQFKLFVYDTDFEGKLLFEFESKSKQDMADQLTTIVKKYT